MMRQQQQRLQQLKWTEIYSNVDSAGQLSKYVVQLLLLLLLLVASVAAANHQSHSVGCPFHLTKYTRIERKKFYRRAFYGM